MGIGLTMCREQDSYGILRIDATSDGTFEIYRIASESPLQFVSEQVGAFNSDVRLIPGSYLVLADCSSETIVVLPGSTKRLLAHTINFLPAHAPAPEDRFSVQCVRSERTRSRQHIENRFSLKVLGGQRDLLVGMLPFKVDLPDETEQQIRSWRLSALKIESPESTTANDAAKKDPKGKTEGVANERGKSTRTLYRDLSGSPDTVANDRFFVSPLNEMVSVTEPQEFGHWQYLLAGTYHVEVNGTHAEIALAEGEQRTITTGYLRVATSNKVDLQLSSQISGSPLYVEINDGHWLGLNETYAVLPGRVDVSLNGATHAMPIEIATGEFRRLEARSVTVDLGCSPWEWACLSDRSVRLYLPDRPYPFVSGVSDVPLLYLEDEVLLGIEGSKDIRYRIPRGTRDLTLRVGYLDVKPVPMFQKGIVTDLIRLEPTMTNAEGHTLDIPLDKPSRIAVVAGNYHLAQYVMSTTIDGDRKRTAQGVGVNAGRTTTLTVNVFLSERRLAAIKRAQEEELRAKAKPSTSGAHGRHEPAAPLELF